MTAEIEQKTEQTEIVEPAIPGTLTATRLDLPPDLPRERWVEVGRTLRTMERGIQFWVGDWLAFGEARYGEEAFADLGAADQTLANWAWVARSVHPSRRREKVRFSHHAEVSSLPPDEQEEVLEKVEREGLNVLDTREEVSKRHRARAESDAAQDGHRVRSERTYEYCGCCGSPESAWSRRPEEVVAGG